ncbi:ArnT family glycosyltransferase [Planctomycetota bacterium]
MHKYKKTSVMLAVLALIVLSLVIFAGAMDKSVRDEEHMHCAAGVLQSKGQMVYRDFSYPAQPPYLPLLYAGLFKVLPTTHYLFTGRAFSVFCNIVTVLCIVAIFRRVFANYRFAGTLLGIAGAVLYVFNPFVYNISGFAGNHDFVVACIVTAFWLFVSIDLSQSSRYFLAAGIGFLLTLAVCTQLKMVVMLGLFFVMLLIRFKGTLKNRLKNILPFLLAMAVALIWPVWTLIASPKAFYINNFSIPVRYAQVMYNAKAVFGKFELCLVSLAIPGGIILAAITVFLCIAIFRYRGKLAITDAVNAVLAVLLVLVSVLLILIFPQLRLNYFGRLVPFLIISFAYPLVYLRAIADVDTKSKIFRTASIIMIACVASAVGCRFDMLTRVSTVLKPQSWIPVKVHRIALGIARKSTSHKPVATLLPIYALEAGRNIYTELAAGPFAYKVASAMSPDQIDTANIITPKKLKQQLHDSPPSIVILSSPSRDIEFVLLRIAKTKWPEQDYDEQLWERKEYDIGFTVYIRRDKYYKPTKTKNKIFVARNL